MRALGQVIGKKSSDEGPQQAKWTDLVLARERAGPSKKDEGVDVRDFEIVGAANPAAAKSSTPANPALSRQWSHRKPVAGSSVPSSAAAAAAAASKSLPGSPVKASGSVAPTASAASSSFHRTGVSHEAPVVTGLRMKAQPPAGARRNARARDAVKSMIF